MTYEQFFTTDLMIYSENWSSHNKEEIVMPYLKALIDFREEVRTCARAEKNIAMLKVRRKIWTRLAQNQAKKFPFLRIFWVKFSISGKVPRWIVPIPVFGFLFFLSGSGDEPIFSSRLFVSYIGKGLTAWRINACKPENCHLKMRFKKSTHASRKSCQLKTTMKICTQMQKMLFKNGIKKLRFFLVVSTNGF